MRRKQTIRSRSIEAPAWHVPFARVGKNLRRMRRRLDATRRIVQMRERFAVYGTIESPQQLRVLRAETPVDGWMTQAMNCMQRALDALRATHEADPEAPAGSELRRSVVAGFASVTDLGNEFLALNARLEELALYALEFDQFAGVVLPPPPPECTKVRRGAGVATSPIPSCRPRRRLLKAAMVIRRVMRGRAPPPLFSLTHGSPSTTARP
jgi:hypothetical protein